MSFGLLSGNVFNLDMVSQEQLLNGLLRISRQDKSRQHCWGLLQHQRRSSGLYNRSSFFHHVHDMYGDILRKHDIKFRMYVDNIQNFPELILLYLMKLSVVWTSYHLAFLMFRSGCFVTN